mgnify:CR=1 FL=1
MKHFKLPFLFLSLIFSSCSPPTYLFTTGQRTGVDFTQGKWLLNELDCPKDSKEKLTQKTLEFFRDNLHDRLFYINDVNGLLITRKNHLNPNRIKLKELKDGTGFDFFINIVTSKNKSDFWSIELYQNEYETGKNKSTVILEIYDLNLQEIIYSQKVIGIDEKTEDLMAAQRPAKSSALIDNLSFYKTSDKLMQGALKKS